MNASYKAVLWIALTYVTGIASGMVLNGALATKRADAMRPPGPNGFVEQMERAIEPRDNAQRKQLRPYLEAADERNRAIVDGARREMGAVMDSLRTSVGPLLDDRQRERMVNAGRMPEGGRGGRGAPPGLEGDGPPGRGGRADGPPGGPRRGGPPPDRPPPHG